MTTIEKIRAEIERQIKDPQEHCYGVSSVNKLRELLSFLDILESEKPMNQDELEKEINRYLREECSDDDEPSISEVARHFYDLGCRRTAEKYDEIEYNRQREEEQTCKGFEEEFRRFIKKEKEEEPDGSLPCYGDYGIYRIARHFAQWGAEHLKK